MNIKSIKYFKKNKPLIIFILLEIISLVLIINPNTLNKLPTRFIHNFIQILDEQIVNIKNYTEIKRENQNLILQNKKLSAKLLNINTDLKQNDFQIYSKKLEQYNLIPSKVINNSIIHSKNYITLNKGSKHGIKRNMGVITNDGIVGKVKYVSENYSTLISILNTKMNTSIRLNKCNILGTLKWNGIDPTKAQILYIPKYAKVSIGEKIITSGYNAIFPENIFIGKIISFEKKENKLFYEIIINLNTNFASLKNVYIIQNNDKEEIENLENKTKAFYE